MRNIFRTQCKKFPENSLQLTRNIRKTENISLSYDVETMFTQSYYPLNFDLKVARILTQS